MESIKFATSYLTFYLKGEVSFMEDHVGLRIPNTILGFIPLGRNKQTLDIKHIISTSSDFRVRISQMLFGLFCFFAGIFFSVVGFSNVSFTYALLAILYILIGVFLVLNSLQTTVTISLASSEVIVFPIVIFEKKKADLIEQAINERLAARTYDTNVRVHTDRSILDNRLQTDRVIDAINAR